jgi:RNA polymerase sigma factor (sigma-70 family)
MMDDDLYQRCMQALRQRNFQEQRHLSEATLHTLASELVARVPAKRLVPLVDTIVANYLNHRQQVAALLDPEHPDHNDQWRIATDRISYIARLRGFADTKDSATDLDDLVQIVSIEFCSSLSRYYFESTLDTWLHSVTLRRLRRFRRDLSAAKRSAIREPFELAVEIPDPTADDSSRVIAAELCDRIRDVLERQKGGKRLAVVFFLHALADRSTEEIGDLIGRHPSRVRSLLKTAREVLRRELGDMIDQADRREVLVRFSGDSCDLKQAEIGVDR